MTKGKRRGDGSKRRHGHARPTECPSARPPRITPGFERLDEQVSRGSSDSVEEFVRDTFEKLIVYVLKEIEAQKAGSAPARPFDANGQASISLPATMNFSIRGGNLEDTDGGAMFCELLSEQQRHPEATHTATAATLPEVLSERIGSLAKAADDVIESRVESGLLESFALVCFVLLSDTKSLIEIRFELLPPSPFQEHRGNDPLTS